MTLDVYIIVRRCFDWLQARGMRANERAGYSADAPTLMCALGACTYGGWSAAGGPSR